MASGLEHYREAEKLVRTAAGMSGDGPVREYLAAAQVHATLAVADSVLKGLELIALSIHAVHAMDNPSTTQRHGR